LQSSELKKKTNCENNKREDALKKLHHPNVVKLYHVDSDWTVISGE
jgi:hypothetical protein